jgi:hypothetical protein
MDVRDHRNQSIKIQQNCPPQIKLPITYAPAFDPSETPISLNNLIFERAALLFNLAALYSQLAATEDRSSVEGIKRAAFNYQVCYSYPLLHTRLYFVSKRLEHFPFYVPLYFRNLLLHVTLTKCRLNYQMILLKD